MQSQLQWDISVVPFGTTTGVAAAFSAGLLGVIKSKARITTQPSCGLLDLKITEPPLTQTSTSIRPLPRIPQHTDEIYSTLLLPGTGPDTGNVALIQV